VRGASGILDEVDEARLIVECLSIALNKCGVDTVVFHDDVSKAQSENLQRIVDFHNSQARDLDISVHFNAYEQVSKPMGTEVLYLTQFELAEQVSEAIASCGFIDRGPKKRTDLFFLNETAGPAILIEVCFVDSEADASIYYKQFDAICEAIADVLDVDNELAPAPEALFRAVGPCSYFGGPEDSGVSSDEGLAFISEVGEAEHLFLPSQPEGSSGLARRLNPFVHYVACRWDYSVTPKASLLEGVALVRSTRTGLSLTAFPADWGPHESTGRVADLSPSLMADLGLLTDDEVEVIYPYEEDE
jgi:hypothetical protein